MRKTFGTRRRKLFGGTAALIVVAAIATVGAWAYYGGSGTGSATASAGHAPRTVTVTGALVGGPLYPGTNGDVDITVTLTGPGNARVGSVELDPSQGDIGIGGLPPGCDRGWFDFAGPASFPAGANVTAGSPLHVTGSLAFVESGTLQDECSDAALTLYLIASPS